MARSLLIAAAAFTLAAGCGAEAEGPPPPSADVPAAAREHDGRTPPDPVPVASCRAGSSNCRTASGTVIYVEAVDPDGDGDAHLVLAGADSITAPGISVIDVAADLRPEPLPRIGSEVSASGPVYRGSYGQRQIQATAITVGTDR